jgi:plastocyanin
MTTRNKQKLEGLWRLFIMMALVACEQMVEPVFAATAAHVRVVDSATVRTATIPVGNLHRRAVSQQTAATTEKIGAKVSIANFTFTPAEITIAPGESVTWTNDDGAPHGLVYEDGAKGTDLLLPGASFSRRFDRPGTYDYSCAVHPYMTGRVVVRAE